MLAPVSRIFLIKPLILLVCFWFLFVFETDPFSVAQVGTRTRGKTGLGLQAWANMPAKSYTAAAQLCLTLFCTLVQTLDMEIQS